MSQLFKLLSDHSRLMILLALESEPLSVSKLIEITGLSQPLVSFHLKILREANLVLTQRHGTFVYNAVCDQNLIPLIRQFEKYQPDVAPATSALPFNCPPWQKSEGQ
ncbi:ArsR/SmtB family transcription factor [Petrocella sp. FN5]|uniref:ArsR/SmtB family transcription factor n=1 Tax=Petrocella sp. FN5 TaxID=3032002 RepID=UPI003FA68C8C